MKGWHVLCMEQRCKQICIEGRVVIADFEFASGHVSFFRVFHSADGLLVTREIILKVMGKSLVEVMLEQQCESERGGRCHELERFELALQPDG